MGLAQSGVFGRSAASLGGQARKRHSLFARCFRRGAAKRLRRGIEGGGPALSCSRFLHAREQSIELPGELVEALRAFANQSLEFLHRYQDGAGRIVFGDRDRAAAIRLEDCPGFTRSVLG